MSIVMMLFRILIGQGLRLTKSHELEKDMYIDSFLSPLYFLETKECSYSMQLCISIYLEDEYELQQWKIHTTQHYRSNYSVNSDPN